MKYEEPVMEIIFVKKSDVFTLDGSNQGGDIDTPFRNTLNNIEGMD